MIKTQKLIKYFGFTLAILLIIGIFAAIIGFLSSIFGFSLRSENVEYQARELNNSVSELEIEINASQLVFKKGDVFKIDYNSDDVFIKESNRKIEVEERFSFFNNDTTDEVIVYIPSDKDFDKVSIEAGSGSVDIELINTKVLDLDLGAGVVNIENMNVTSKCEIDAGAGKLEVTNGSINNLDLDMGIGKTVINGVLQGNSDIDAGVGELDINLLDTIDNYNFIINKGIGSISINGENVNNNYQYGTGVNNLKIDGGIGSIVVTTQGRK